MGGEGIKNDGREAFKVTNENPAPGEYNIKSKIVEGKAFKITTDNKKYAHDYDADKKTPGVGDYDPNHYLKYQNISCSFKPKPKIDYDNNSLLVFNLNTEYEIAKSAHAINSTSPILK